MPADLDNADREWSNMNIKPVTYLQIPTPDSGDNRAFIPLNMGEDNFNLLLASLELWKERIIGSDEDQADAQEFETLRNQSDQNFVNWREATDANNNR